MIRATLAERVLPLLKVCGRAGRVGRQGHGPASVRPSSCRPGQGGVPLVILRIAGQEGAR